MKRKICLFTAHSPQTGGGGVILRSLTAHLSELSFDWYYVAGSVAAGYEKGYLGRGIMGGAILKDIIATRKMLKQQQVPEVDAIVNALLQANCDAYWIVTHNEGLRVAAELIKRQTSRPVHVTVHDDWAGALCARSVRYKYMKRAADKLTVWVLQHAASVDVISTGMQAYYQKMCGVETIVCHRYLPADAIARHPYKASADATQLVVGHIGSIYDKKDFVSFLSMLVQFAQSKGQTAMLKMWGCHLSMGDIPGALQGNITFYPTLPEDKALPELSQCAFVYAMYPFAPALKIFGATSLPTKLTSYLQAGRPVLGHGPADSTLSSFLKDTGIGAMWNSGDQRAGFAALEAVSRISFDTDKWQRARVVYFGEKNLQVMSQFLNPQGE
ncbi:hypothetical protein C8P68_102168 [Mucilaginibacter yixingensis]|uniref:Glycosyltransferase involved in cell wall biosynthesis n=1 Tax=Mucilaginibacter yixingensis TaxID=1295612 RepID=A0A2T5JC50_9SPHI|nr:hypothetical protein [Mucilaginibacter yixingensis]PTQ99352.1 hypothetical protein C8P68_102168 [Mucilaginibacter yixingensis]